MMLTASYNLSLSFCQSVVDEVFIIIVIIIIIIIIIVVFLSL